MITRDDQGRQVLTIEETAEELGMTVTDGALYAFKGSEYHAFLEPTDSDSLARFECDPDGWARSAEPELYLERDGSLQNPEGANVGDYRDLEAI